MQPSMETASYCRTEKGLECQEIVSTCKVRCSQQPCFLQGGILVLLALLGHDLALRKPPNINQKWKAGLNTAVE